MQAYGLPIVEHDGFGKLNTAMHGTMADGSDRRLAELPGVISRHVRRNKSCPLYLRKRTFAVQNKCPLCANSGHGSPSFGH